MGGGQIFVAEEGCQNEDMMENGGRRGEEFRRFSADIDAENGDKGKTEDTYARRSAGRALEGAVEKERMSNKKDGRHDADKLKKKLANLDHKLEKILLGKEECLRKLKEREDEALCARRAEGRASREKGTEAREWKQKTEREKEERKGKEGTKQHVQKSGKRLEELYDGLGYLLREAQEYLEEIKRQGAEPLLQSDYKS